MTGPVGKVIRREDGVAISVDGAQLAEPRDAFLADFASARASPDGTKLLFAKSHPLSHAAVALVEVLIPTFAFAEAVWPTIAGPFLEGLKRHCAAAFPRWEPQEVLELERAQFHARRASLAQISYTNDEAQVDFHLISTSDVSNAIQGRRDDVGVAAVLRVLLSTPLLLQLMVECESIARERGR